MRVWLLALVCATAVPAATALAGGPETERQVRRACVVQVKADDDDRPRERARLRRTQRPPATPTQQAQPQAQSCPAEAPQASGRRYLPHYFL